MLSEMEKENILYSVSVTGGEPLLFKGFDKLCKVLAKHNIPFLTMNTNAQYLDQHLEEVDGLFDWVDISRHSISEEENQEIFGTKTVPSIDKLKEIKSKLKKTKMRLQCVMHKVNTVDKMLDFINTFNFTDDISFRKLMKLGPEYGVSVASNETEYLAVLDYAYDNFKFVEQSIQDYYVYEIWEYNGVSVTFSYSNMKLLREVEHIEDPRNTREFVIHPNGIISASWDYHDKVLKR